MVDKPDVFIVRGSLQLLESSGVMNPTIQKTLWGTGTSTITADRDYFIVGIMPIQAGAWCLSETNVTTAQIQLANNTVYDVIAAMIATTWVISPIQMRYFWKSGKRLNFNSAGGIGILMILELAT